MATVKFVWVFSIVTIALIGIYYKSNESNFNPESIRGKRILITGSSSGIGEEIAYQYSKMGASVMLTARREKVLRKVAAKCMKLGATKAEYLAIDMGKPKEREYLVDKISSKLGGIDHLILNHATFYFDVWKNSLENMTALEESMDINFISYVDIASRSMKMLSDSNGSIGILSSTAGKVGGVFVNFYSPSKYALDGFFSSLRQELQMKRINVSITLFILGYIATDSANKIKEKLVPNLRDPQVANVNDSARTIIEGVENRSYVVYYPLLEWFLVTLGLFFPQFNDRFRLSILPEYLARPDQYVELI